MPEPLRLPPKSRLPEAEELLAQLRPRAADPELAIDASAVEEIAASSVVVLVAAIREREKAGLTTAVAQPSPAFVDAFSDLGFFQDLMKLEFRQ
ncbi:STAS domain-containing protein [Oceanicella actignis]|uniref:STAS domain-containing protein n=1 Tax=Oceanicella actignis TaxID=1189325 RepID=A0A1M7T5D9_9RHOB|nr:STAS domain-containing protein [Oceanicella actignis]TYO84867.1 STAS domain-containing protein [Oceanicella actignis]SET43408.1 STAS domain-containing protein [Oceanicella actignis]SHN65980.1 STAS domain-containing protein [Oceanicella actignis]